MTGDPARTEERDVPGTGPADFSSVAGSAPGRATVETGPGESSVDESDVASSTDETAAPGAAVTDGSAPSGTTPAVRRGELSLKAPKLPRWAPGLSALVAAAASALVALMLGWGPIAFGVVAAVLYAVGLPTWAMLVENRRAATDRLVTTLVWSAFAIALVPLVSLTWTVVSKGAPAFSAEFFTYSMRNVVGEGGGIYHAVVGTLLITGMAAVLSIPIGLMTAIYLVEYGAGRRPARVINFLVDVMTGIPSIVAGLFAFALFAIFFGPGVRMGFGGSVALSVLMIPVVVRSCEEMLKLVPNELREAAYALGVPKWRTIVKVVLPTSMAGIVTGVMLAIARVAGETAPLLVIAGATDSVNFDLFGERMMTLPVFAYYSYMQPGVPPEFGVERAWGAALALIIIVMALNLLGRLLGRLFAPKTGR
ncbi:phosphate transport system permease protein [Nocardioides massiliensis]|uniref:Phosphate transport system permease protein PstA n=3 Tax=Nocardioides massiliensis TaxID=1325935 RepID=A0ABT9NPF0_9ACTN|nr:phosphate ABC transporter permease PstA [Nocardioides massiliensis]MDP9821735.1 phosphate transport system permease protein [Nocardioides massiliensis]